MYSTTKQETKDARRADAKKSVEQATADLLEEIKAGKTERLQQFLDFAARFHKYSYANQHIIATHARRRDLQSTFVASYQGWQELGKQKHGQPYQVRKGETAIWIWAPRPYKAVNKQTEEEEQRLGFILVPVFADYQIDQSEGQPPLDPFFHALPDDDEVNVLYERLSQIAKDEGFTVQEEARPDRVRGYFDRDKTIAVADSLDTTSKFLVLIHEYAHALLHKNTELGMRDRECEAEATAYTVAKHFSITSPFTAEYLMMYGNDEKTLTARLESIRQVAHQIIDKLEKALHSELAEAA